MSNLKHMWFSLYEPAAIPQFLVHMFYLPPGHSHDVPWWWEIMMWCPTAYGHWTWQPPPPPGNVAPYEILVSGKGRGRLTSHPLPCLLKKVGLQGTILIIPACGWLSGVWKVWMMAQNHWFWESPCVILRATTRASNDTMAMQALFFFWLGRTGGCWSWFSTAGKIVV